jgi:predicted AAA+ superfamily ATPase
MKNNIIRDIQEELRNLHDRSAGRLLIVTGARQCGKTTLAQMAFPNYPVIPFDAPMERAVYAEMAPSDWLAQYPNAVLDEVQKLPTLFDTVKACHDRDEEARYVLLGSSQVLLMKQVCETLAGRAAIRELYPFSMPELLRRRHSGVTTPNALVSLLTASDPMRTVGKLFPPSAGLDKTAAGLADCWDYFQRWGGMPKIADPEWNDNERFNWLTDYQNTYLQRDLGDLARLDRLEPFVRAQKAAAGRTSQLVNHSEIARLSEISSHTAKEFLRYLEISYQVFLLPAWFRNPEKRLTKQPKLHFIDPGIRRAVLQTRGEPDGAEFESAVVAEIYKRVRSARLPVQMHHLRTADGREVDLLIEREDGFIAIECKQTTNPQPTDARHLRSLENLLDKPLRLAIVVCNGRKIRDLGDSSRPLPAVPAHLLLS